tara:strand:+ start:105 stop:278 length:174 start_codon:yes stop_codon:yes gene_type:complete
MLTYEEVKEKLLMLDEVTLMELLQVSSEDLVDNFDDKLLANYPFIYEQITGESLGEL